MRAGRVLSQAVIDHYEHISADGDRNTAARHARRRSLEVSGM